MPHEEGERMLSFTENGVLPSISAIFALVGG
jgi:hypothetical protein